MLQNAYKFDSTPPVSLQAARVGTPTSLGRTRSETQLHLLLDTTSSYYPNPSIPDPTSRKGGKSRKKRSRKRR